MTTFIVPSFDEEPWPSLGGPICDLIEERAVFGPGSLKGEPARLDDEKRAAIWKAYEVYPRGHELAGRRRFRRVRISWRKGTAKTEFGGWVAFVELHSEGPVRFDGWDADGNPVGRPVRDPYIPLLATTQEQVMELAYGVLYTVCTEGPDADLFDSSLERIIRLGERGADGKAVPLAGSPNARDGARTTFQYYDETHRLNSPTALSAYEAMEANLPKRPLDDPWSLGTTTAGEPGKGSVAEKDKDEAELISKGEVDEPELFYFHREAGTHDPTTGKEYDLSVMADRIEAIREASGPSVAAWSDLRGIAKQWDRPRADPRYLERTWLNRWTQAEAQAFDARRWKDELAKVGATIPRRVRRKVTLGFDGSRWKDTTGLVVTDIETGLQQKFGLWVPDYADESPDGTPEVRVHEVNEGVDEAFKVFDVVRMYLDPAQGWDEQGATWAGKYGPKKVLFFYTDSRNLRRTAEMCRSYAGAIKAGEVTNDGDEDLASHIANAQKREIKMVDDEGQPLWVMSKERHDSLNKIDLAMAGGLSWQARLDAIASGVSTASSYFYTASTTRRR
ncbi:terminase [Oerskovia rustica]|uniref:Terminase n=1 Tax=Oerskovia rustica TaxID=2762237 RepID=A0ABR8RP82_9CELL|nr:terminase [Oerskovia rustica]MBD7949600.1 terminase [Oerskovia rustica]